MLNDHPAVSPLLARCRFVPSGRISCAVSGGADSSALLVLAVASGLEVTAYHVDHGLRSESAAEAAVVAELAERVGARFVALKASIEPGSNLEARARLERYRALPPDVCTGHTADDQAETLLLNLLRGTGIDGLAAIRPSFRRPILPLRRSETRVLCDSLGLTVLEDPSNLDPAFKRNRIRHELLPLLAEIGGRDPVPLLGRAADHARSASDLLEMAAAVIDPTDARTLAKAPPELARRALRRWLRVLSAEDHPPDAAAVERVLEVARGVAGATEVAGGWRVERHDQRLALVPPA